jgi:hypothetical protein
MFNTPEQALATEQGWEEAEESFVNLKRLIGHLYYGMGVPRIWDNGWSDKRRSILFSEESSSEKDFDLDATVDNL